VSDVQVIEKDGKPVFYVLPAALWELVREAVENAEDVAAYDRAKAADDGVTFPAAVAHAIADGASPLKAWREHKGLTVQALADAAGVSKPYVSQIEGGKRTGTAATLARLAQALGVPVGALVL
jgi:antitoxin component HigA of HigAB toxin-antitoxin module